MYVSQWNTIIPQRLVYLDGDVVSLGCPSKGELNDGH